MCSKTFYQDVYSKSHFCEDCGKYFKFSTILTKHMKKYHQKNEMETFRNGGHLDFLHLTSPSHQWEEDAQSLSLSTTFEKFCKFFQELENGRPIGRHFLGHGRALWALD